MARLQLDGNQRRTLKRKDVLVLPLDGAAEQPKILYWNKYGERVRLPGDARSQHDYTQRGFSLSKPRKVLPRPVDGVGTEDWDGTKQAVDGQTFDLEQALAESPTFTELKTQLEELTALLRQAVKEVA